MSVQRLRQVVPSDFAATLRQMRAESDVRLDSTLDLAFRRGWTMSALARAMGLDKSTVHSRIRGLTYRYSAEFLPDIPPLPMRQPPPPSPLMTDGVVAELRAMYVAARQAAAGAPRSSRRASMDFSGVLAGLVDKGVTLSELARVLDTVPSAIHARIARYRAASDQNR